MKLRSITRLAAALAFALALASTSTPADAAPRGDYYDCINDYGDGEHMIPDYSGGYWANGPHGWWSLSCQETQGI